MMLDDRRNLFSDDLQRFGTKILTQKFALFGILGWRERKNGALWLPAGFRTKIVLSVS